MDFLLFFVPFIAASFLGSVALGFMLNRFVLRRIKPGPTKAIAVAASRAIFYAPSIVFIGHGGPFPLPLLMVLALSYRGVSPTVGVLTFLLPGAVFLGSLALAWSKPFGVWFCVLLAAHLAVFGVLPLALSLDGARVLFSISAFPWYPIQHLLHLPDPWIEWLMLPNPIAGQLWCLVVWLLLYASLALALTRLSLRLSRTRTDSVRGA
jgi:hypothetical protein